MENHDWEIILALSGTITAMAGWIVRYLMNELNEARTALKKVNDVNAELAAMVPKLMEELKSSVGK